MYSETAEVIWGEFTGGREKKNLNASPLCQGNQPTFSHKTQGWDGNLPFMIKRQRGEALREEAFMNKITLKKKNPWDVLRKVD